MARAFFGYPRLIVLDEPNASLDPEGEDALRQSINELRERGSTIVVIAQRLGILNSADKILVLNNGKLDAIGSKNDLAGKLRGGRRRLTVSGPKVITATARTKPGTRDERQASLKRTDATGREEAQWPAS